MAEETENVKNSGSYLSNRPQVSMVYRLIETTRDVGRTREELVNHEPQASDLRILRVKLVTLNNTEEAQFFHGFTGTINHSQLINQSARNYLVII